MFIKVKFGINNNPQIFSFIYILKELIIQDLGGDLREEDFLKSCQMPHIARRRSLMFAP